MTTGTELMFSDVLKLSSVVEMDGKQIRMSLRDPMQVYMFSRFIAPTNTYPFSDITTRDKIIEALNDPTATMTMDNKNILKMLTYGDFQYNFIDLFIMYLLPLFSNFAGWIPSDYNNYIYRDTVDMVNRQKEYHNRDIICGVHHYGLQHFVPYIVLYRSRQILYLDSMGARNGEERGHLSEGTKIQLFKILKYVCFNKNEPNAYDEFKILELDFPKSDFFQDGGNSCMIWSCVILFVFLKHFHKCIAQGIPPQVPLESDGKSYDFQKISGDIFVSKEGLLSFQRGVLNLILKTIEFNEFVDENWPGIPIAFNIGVVNDESAKKTLTENIKKFMYQTSKKRDSTERDVFYDKYKILDNVWGYVLVGDCGIPREILGACAELTRDKSSLDEISKKFTTSKLTMLMAAMHYNQDHNVLLQLFNAIPDKTNTKTLSDRTALPVNTFPYLGVAV
jgi:hypothetical protein